MASAINKITLSASRDIPFNKLLLSACNVRRIKAGVSIQELADDIARRSLLQSLTVRPVLDADGQETGRYEIPAGGRRYRALELLVGQKRLAKTAPIPCVVRTEGIAEEDSLAENVQRAPLHPLDQFRAFLTLRQRGLSEGEIAAAFFVPVAVVKQRLRLASVSPTLLDVYAEDGMTLEQLMAFTVSADHARQAQVWDAVQHGYNREAYLIRRMLTEGAVRAADRRARFVGVDAYEAAGGVVSRDLFAHDDGGWLDDAALLGQLATEKLAREAKTVGVEGWKWVEAALDFPYGHTIGLGRVDGARPEVSDAAQGAHEGDGDLPDEVDARLTELETAIEAFNDAPVAYDPTEIARAGAFVSVDANGELRVERGFVRPEDEPPVAIAPVEGEATSAAEPVEPTEPTRAAITVGGQPLPDPDGGEGRRAAAAVGAAGDRTHGAPDPGAARRGGRRPGHGALGRAARALPADVLPLRPRELPGAQRQVGQLRHPGPRFGGVRVGQGNRRPPRGLGQAAAARARRAVAGAGGTRA